MRAQILSPTPEHVALAAQSLKRGEVVGMPTETVYGLAGNAFDPTALAQIFDTKERPTFDPLIVHVAPGLFKKTLAESKGGVLSELARLRLIDVTRLSERARLNTESLISAFWPGPLTLVLPKHSDVPDLVTSGLDSVALRMPAHPIAQAMIVAAGTPLAAPSANRFGRISPTTAQAVFEELGDRIEWIVDGGACTVGVESTVLRVSEDGALTQLRPGGVSRDEIERATGAAVATTASSSQPASLTSAQASPGMLESHYAPSKPLHLLPSQIANLSTEDLERILMRSQGQTHLGFLLMSGDPVAAALKLKTRMQNELDAGRTLQISALSLSAAGDLTESARNLFATLRALDASSARALFAEPCLVSTGLGHAIADRLGRACGGKSFY